MKPTNNTLPTQPDAQQPADEGLDDAVCSAYVTIRVYVDNLFTKSELAQRGISEHDMVLECFENPFELVGNAEELTVEGVQVVCPNTNHIHPEPTTNDETNQ